MVFLYEAAHHSIFKSKTNSPCGEKYRSLLQYFPFAIFLLGYEYWMFINYFDPF